MRDELETLENNFCFGIMMLLLSKGIIKKFPPREKQKRICMPYLHKAEADADAAGEAADFVTVYQASLQKQFEYINDGAGWIELRLNVVKGNAPSPTSYATEEGYVRAFIRHMLSGTMDLYPRMSHAVFTVAQQDAFDTHNAAHRVYTRCRYYGYRMSVVREIDPKNLLGLESRNDECLIP